MKLVILGTGCPGVRMDGIRANASETIIFEDDILLFDCGRWVSYRLVQAGFKPWHVNYLFFTHIFHFDHMCDYPNLIFSRYLGREGSAWNLWENTKKLNVYGPRGMKEFSEKVRKAFNTDFRTEMMWKELTVEEVGEGLVAESNSWRISAISTTHRDSGGIPSLAYRVDSEEASIVISGDITWNGPKEENFIHNPRLMQLAKEVDIFIVDTDDTHTTPEAVGKLLAETNPKKAVLTHLQNPGLLPPRLGETQPRYWPTNDELVKIIGRFYSGEIIVGEDLRMIIL